MNELKREVRIKNRKSVVKDGRRVLKEAEAENLEKLLKFLFGRKHVRKLLLLYYRKPELKANLSMLTEILPASFLTLEKAVADLTSLGVFVLLDCGRSRVLLLNEDSELWRVIVQFLSELERLEGGGARGAEAGVGD